MYTKGVIRSRKSKNVGQYNGQTKNDKRINNNLQNTTQKPNDRPTRTPPKTGDKLRCSGSVRSSCSTSDTRRVTLNEKTIMSYGYCQYTLNNTNSIYKV